MKSGIPTDPLVHQFVNAELSEGPVKFHYPGPGVLADFGSQPACGQKGRA
jgi:phospholipid/cholesterol/gamma-HCH transport system ATP-binding protein